MNELAEGLTGRCMHGTEREQHSNLSIAFPPSVGDIHQHSAEPVTACTFTPRRRCCGTVGPTVTAAVALRECAVRQVAGRTRGRLGARHASDAARIGEQADHRC